MSSQISPNQTGIDVAERLVNSSENPNSCPCGWYVYYSAVCGHVYQEVKHQCGAFQSVKYESGNKTRASARGRFCKTPAPKNIVQGVQINVKCQHC
ncbi:hypothetical protein N7489_009868 [Penicillium chrysogenum]|uniref:uncharacterized protein n=1 Tax=Penicillium chrysogenum TaxID=5076 RepID=UPI002399F03F|nr:uncharacterized protein N7489_009868 [Penicillium chrysogenum]KAJ5229160.1 hypothetical protein N7489_009868 [Penicillium chrysogenum]KAJ5258561.1 hypothetical protein N7524_010117 [Penicillium chrysogenum]